MLNILGFIVVALLAGFIARALVPGRDAMSIPQTMLLGAVGSFIGGALAVIFTHDKWKDFSASGIIGSVIGAIVALLLYRKFGKSLKR
jgi:uncharacterized membrane protein YeaQ/YmgE (transglycosylase-associated protein family)